LATEFLCDLRKRKKVYLSAEQPSSEKRVW
jgi:hypothetical protein